jgi:hypothetical protein
MLFACNLLATLVNSGSLNSRKCQVGPRLNRLQGQRKRGNFEFGLTPFFAVLLARESQPESQTIIASRN